MADERPGARSGWSNYQLFLGFMMLITGSINTLSTKWADNTESKGLDGKVRPFDHPFLQAVGMFIGEFSCLLVFKLIVCHNGVRGVAMNVGDQQFSPFIFLPAALCDMCGTSIMYFGLNLTYASSFQMLRGAVMIFTALLSVAFLDRRIRKHMWLGMVMVVVGLVVVGLADVVFGNHGQKERNRIITGDLLIVIAQVVVAVQMVYEEKVVNAANVPPLQAVGWEGFFGMLILGTLLVPMYYIKVGKDFTTDPDGRLENALDAFEQMKNSWMICLATVGNIVSIAFFNFSGISITREMSATTRMVLDSCRTVIIWMVALGVGWQAFQALQVLGFAILIGGMCIYNDIVFAPFLRRKGCLRVGDQDERQPLLVEDQPGIQD